MQDAGFACDKQENTAYCYTEKSEISSSIYGRYFLLSAVWVDETGCDRRDILRKSGYAFRGERAICHRLLVRGT